MPKQLTVARLNTPDEPLLVPEAAKMLRLHPEYLRCLLRAGRIGAHKPGRDWLIPKTEVARYLGLLSTDTTNNN